MSSLCRYNKRACRLNITPELIEAARAFVVTLPDARASVSGTESIAMGSEPPLAFDLRGRLPLEELAALADTMIEELERKGGFVDLDRGLIHSLSTPCSTPPQ